MDAVNHRGQFPGAAQRSLGGANPSTVYALTGDSVPHIGFEVWDDTGLVLWRLCKTGAATCAFVAIAGEGLITAGWPKYVVHQSITVPTSPYATWTAAIAAAVADGHGASQPTTIYGLDGAWVEDITVPLGISLRALRGSPIRPLQFTPEEAGVRITGTITVDTAGGTVGVPFAMSGGIAVSGNIVFTGGGVMQVRLSDVWVQATVGDALSIPAGALGATSSVYMARCDFTSLAGGAASGATVAGVNAVVWDNCHVGADDHGATLGAGTHTARNGTFFDGGLDLAASTTLNTQNCQLFTFGRAGVVFAAASGTVSWVGGTFDVRVALSSGAGTLRMSGDITWSTGTVNSKATATVTATRYAFRPRQILPAVGASTPFTTPDLTEVIKVNTGGIAAVVMLPTLTTRMQGEVLEYKSISAAGDISVTPQTGEIIDGLAANAPYVILAGAAGFTSKRFYADVLASRWWSLA
jgi:hypothetical protein